MRTQIQKWGNSLAVRIPKAIAVELKIQQGAEVELTLEQGRVVLTPVEPPAYTLENLLTGVRKDNLHEQVDTGGSLGRELW